MKLLLFGAGGQVGFELHRSLAALGEVIAATRSGVLPGGAACERADLDDPDSVAALVRRVRPAWVVNAAAYTAVDRAEDEAGLARRTNADALGAIGAAARSCKAAVLHYSTDYVFDGSASRPWLETDAVAPLNAYGRSKLEGERALAASGAAHLILRTAWVYSARGQNFLRTMLKLADRASVRVVDDQRGAPTPARWLADASAQAIAVCNRSGAAAAFGTYHATAAGETTWYGFARHLFEGAMEAGLIATMPEVAPIASADYPTRAQRPRYSVLDGARLEQSFGIHRPDWQAGLALTLAEIAAGTLAP